MCVVNIYIYIYIYIYICSSKDLALRLCPLSIAPWCSIFDLDQYNQHGFRIRRGSWPGTAQFPKPCVGGRRRPPWVFMAPEAYRLALANDRARSFAPLERPMVPLDPPSPDVTYDHRSDKAERMDRKRARYMRPQAPPNAPIPRYILESILQDSATTMAKYPKDLPEILPTRKNWQGSGHVC